jgi:hypothetical protein
MFLTRRKTLTGGWRKIHDAVIHNLYTSSYILRMIKWKTIGCIVMQHALER